MHTYMRTHTHTGMHARTHVYMHAHRLTYAHMSHAHTHAINDNYGEFPWLY